eukprot:4746060-Prymnesium_polylepis.3
MGVTHACGGWCDTITAFARGSVVLNGTLHSNQVSSSQVVMKKTLKGSRSHDDARRTHETAIFRACAVDMWRSRSRSGAAALVSGSMTLCGHVHHDCFAFWSGGL